MKLTSLYSPFRPRLELSGTGVGGKYKNYKLMKSILFNFAVVFGFILSATGVLRAQYVVDTVRYQPVDTIRTAPENDRQLRKTAENPDVYQNGNTAGKYYKWETPVFDMVDVDGIKQHKTDNEQYLYEVEVLEKVVNKNRKELKSYQDQAKDYAKVLRNEQKNLKEKRNFYKEDEKLLKKENKLRGRELKLLRKERKEFKKKTDELSDWQVQDRLAQFDDRERRIEAAQEKWGMKRETLKYNVDKLADQQKILDEKDYEISERIRQLDVYQRDQDLKSKQLAVERKQAKLEIKKAKAALKQKK